MKKDRYNYKLCFSGLTVECYFAPHEIVQASTSLEMDSCLQKCILLLLFNLSLILFTISLSISLDLRLTKDIYLENLDKCLNELDFTDDQRLITQQSGAPELVPDTAISQILQEFRESDIQEHIVHDKAINTNARNGCHSHGRQWAI